MRTLKWVILIVFPILTACAQAATLTMTPSMTATNKSTATSTPTNTITPVPTQTPTPTPFTPAFSGRILAMSGGDIFELSASTEFHLPNSTLITSRVSAAISPDLRTIAYSHYSYDPDGNATHLYDLENRTDGIILPYNADDISWSTDGQRFSYLVNNGVFDPPEGLYVYELASNTARFVYAPPCAGYGYIGNSRRVCGASRDMFWVSPNVMVFQRYKGAMPQEIGGFQVEIPANTTTLLFVTGGSPVLVDSPRRWLLQDSCGDQVLLREEIDKDTFFSIAEAAEFTAHPGSIVPTPLRSCPEGSDDCASLPGSWNLGFRHSPYVGFLPNSCNVFYFSGKSPDILLHILVPGTLEDRSLLFPTRLGVITFPGVFTWTAGWPGSADAQIAVTGHYYPPEIEIVNMHTAEKRVILKADSNESTLSILGWIAP
jgi:hypothetical protein